jgi:hypothetical protein
MCWAGESTRGNSKPADALFWRERYSIAESRTPTSDALKDATCRKWLKTLRTRNPLNHLCISLAIRRDVGRIDRAERTAKNDTHPREGS